MNQRLLRRYRIPVVLLLASYGIPVLLMLASYALGLDRGPEVVGATVTIVVYAFVGIGAPVASLWIFWLIWHEPGAQRVTRKVARLGGILLTLTPPIILAIATLDIIRQDTNGMGTLFGGFVFLPWSAIQIVAGIIALLRVAFQRRAISETASAPASVG